MTHTASLKTRFIELMSREDAAGLRDFLAEHKVARSFLDQPLFSFGKPAVVCARNNLPLLDVLLEFGANINARSHWEPGSYGVLNEAKTTVADALVERGAEWDIHDAVEHGRHSTLANMMVMGALRDRLGFGNVTSAATGGAAMGPDTFKLFLAMGVPLKQLYGQTETLGAYTLQDGKELDVDTVGIPFEGCEVKIENPDPEGVGEIVTRHPNMFTGYYNNPEATASDLRDGWMHTGDAGYFDAKGRLTVIDRVKDMAETSTGVKFSPQYIENKLKFSPYVGEAVILGSGHPYLTAIICVRFSTVSKWAEKNRVGFTSYTGLSADERIYELIRGEVEHVNAGLPEHQRIRRFLLLYKELDADDGELTRTRKVRRGVVSERYGQLIDALYGDAGTARLDTEVMFEDGRRTRVQADMTIMEVGGDAPSGDLRKAG